MVLPALMLFALNQGAFLDFDPKALSGLRYQRAEHFDLGNGESEKVVFEGTSRLDSTKADQHVLVREEVLVRHELDGQPIDVARAPKPVVTKEKWSDKGCVMLFGPNMDVAAFRLNRILAPYLVPADKQRAESRTVPDPDGQYPGLWRTMREIGRNDKGQRHFRVEFAEFGTGASIKGEGTLWIHPKSFEIIDAEWRAEGVPMAGNASLQAKATITLKQLPK